MPSISKTPSTIRTADDQLVDDGASLYHWSPIRREIISFKVAYWHDGKTANLYFNHRMPVLKNEPPHYINMQEKYDGEIIPGIYPSEEENVYCFFPASECYVDLEKCRDVIRNHYEGLLKIILDLPPVEKLTVY